MKLLSRRVNTSKSPEEIMCILQRAAISGKEATFSDTEFSMYCLKKRNFRYRVVVPVKGKIMEPENGLVRLTIHANLPYYFSIFMGFMFVICSINTVYLWICSGEQRWGSLGVLALGMLFSLQPFWDGIEILDSLEDKLTL